MEDIKFYTSVKAATIADIQATLAKRRKYYISSDFPFIQTKDGYTTYQGRILEKFLREKGYVRVRANEIDLARIDNRNVRGNRNVMIKLKDYIQFKK